MFFRKGPFWFELLLKHWQGVKLGVIYIYIFLLQQNIFFWLKHICIGNSWYTTLYLLDLFGLEPKFGLFHYAKLPSYNRVKLGWLCGLPNLHNSNNRVFSTWRCCSSLLHPDRWLWGRALDQSTARVCGSYGWSNFEV